MKNKIRMLLACTMIMTMLFQVLPTNAIAEAGHTYVLRFYDDDGTELCPSITKGYGNSAVPEYEDTINLPTATKEGYDFYGWYVGYHGSWNLITDGKYKVEGIANGTFPQTHYIDFYANWGGDCGDNLKWMIDGKGALKIRGTGSMYDYKIGTAPWTAYSQNIKSVVIEDGVTSVGNNAFWYAGPHYDNITEVIISDSVESIGNWAFCDCDNLTSVTIPKNVKTIGREAFSTCDSLVNIVVNKENQNYASINGVLFDKSLKTFIVYPTGRTEKTYTIPNGVTHITVAAFNCCPYIENIIIPSSVTEIDEGMTTVCGVKNITVNSENQNYTSIDGVLFDKNIKTLLSYPAGNERTSYEIPNSVTRVGYGAFSLAYNLTKITVPDELISIGTYGFEYCSGITSINLPKTLTEIGNTAISSCDSLTDVYYEGNEQEWSAIVIGKGNSSLESATMHYNSEMGRTSQNITIDDIPEKFYGDAPFAVNVTPDATSKLNTFTFESSNTEIAEISSDGTITIKAVGETDITVKQAGDDKFKPTSTTKKLVVSPAEVTVTAVDLNKKTAEISGVLESDKAGVALDFDKIKTTVLSVETSAVPGVTITNVRLSNFILKGDKAKNYIAKDTTIDTKVTASKVLENLTDDGNVSVEAAHVDVNTIIVTDIDVPLMPDDKTISIDVTAIDDTKVNTIVIPKATLDKLVAMSTETILELSLKDGSDKNNTATITFNTEAIVSIKAASGSASTVSISVKKAVNEDLKSAQIAKVDEVSTKNPVVYSLNVLDEAGNSVAGSFGETGIATVEFPYDKQIENGNVLVKLLEDSGNLTNISDVIYNNANKTVTAKLEHFSEYLIYTEPVLPQNSGGGGGGLINHTVKFETNGGSEIKSVNVNRNKTVAEPTAPTKDGYTFAGWYTDKKLTLEYDFDTKVTKSFTLYAKWTEGKTETEKPEDTKPDETKNPFSDVDTDDWFYNAVMFAYKNNITSGISEIEFAPNGKVTRGQFIAMLCRAYDIAKMTGDNFDDAGNTWYTGYLAAAKQLGISNGIGDNKFAPEKEITREEMVTLIYNYLKSIGKADETVKEISFADEDAISQWAKLAVSFASSNGIVAGKNNNMFDPHGTATRAELVQIFYNIFAK